MAQQKLKPGMTCLDATCGNGNDTLTLRSLVGSSGKVYAMDIQKSALESTLGLLKSHEFDLTNTSFIEDSHSNLDQYNLPRMDLIVFNLGYLPKGDKEITTCGETTSIGIDHAIELLNSGGLLFVLSYRGHEKGYQEYEALCEKMPKLPQNKVDVMRISFENQKNLPPLMWVVEKK